jgi:hypothetical protein
LAGPALKPSLPVPIPYFQIVVDSGIGARQKTSKGKRWTHEVIANTETEFVFQSGPKA